VRALWSIICNIEQECPVHIFEARDRRDSRAALVCVTIWELVLSETFVTAMLFVAAVVYATAIAVHVRL
jgi:hypothetical protein